MTSLDKFPQVLVMSLVVMVCGHHCEPRLSRLQDRDIEFQVKVMHSALGLHSYFFCFCELIPLKLLVYTFEVGLTRTVQTPMYVN